MAWLLDAALIAVAAWLCVRVRRLERDVVRQALIYHESANRAMRRAWRDKWRWRQVDAALRIVIRESAPWHEMPDIVRGPPDDPDGDASSVV